MPPIFSLDETTNLINNVCQEELKMNFLISLHFINIEQMREINMKFRNKDYATNVLSFPFNEQIANFFNLGEILLCYEVIVKESNKKEYLLFLILHSLLHLLGFTHEDDINAEKMLLKEEYYLKKLGVEYEIS